MGADSPKQRLLTWRSGLLGLVGVLCMSVLAGYHDNRVPGATLMIGSHLPNGAFFYILGVGLLWNGLLGRFWRRAVLSTPELAVVLAVTLIACYPPTSGLFRYFQRALVLPWYWLSSGAKAEWVRYEVLNQLPPKLFPSPYPVTTNNTFAVSEAVDTVYRGYFTGLAQGSQAVPLWQLPLGNWAACLLGYWLPLVLAVSICLMAMLFLVHRQWSRHEQLSYPLAQVAASFVETGEGRLPRIFRNRLFWWGVGAMLVYYTFEYLSRWFPESVPSMTRLMPGLKGWGVPLHVKLPIITKTPGWWSLSWQTIYFSVAALAFFCSTDVSLTVGLSSILLCLGGVWFYTATGTPLNGNDLNLFRAGAYLGYTGILLYTGRVYFWRIARRAFRRNRGAEEEDLASIMAARLFALAFVAVILVFVWMGQDWLVALFYTTLLTSMFLSLTRIVCETGIPFVQPAWVPMQVMVGLMGPAAIGPTPAVFFSWVSMALCQDPRECLMPFVATGLRVSEGRVRTRRLFWVLVAALLLALVAGFLSTTWTHYNFNAMGDSYAANSVPRQHFDAASRLIGDMVESGQKEAAAARHGLDKLGLVHPDAGDIGYLLTGVVLVVGFSMLRFRFSGFPLHPVLFLIMGSYASQKIWSSFLIGWAIKTIVVRFGGNRFYQAVKPLFIGIIAGEICAAGLFIAIDMLYIGFTGRVPPITLQLFAA